MNTLFTQFKEAVEKEQLSETEKSRMREELVAYMEYKPIRRKQTTTTPMTRGIPLFPFFRAHHFTGALLIAILITTSTFGVTFAADDALPGDLLYGIKVNVNEEIKSALLSSRESRIEWKKERAERRLVEASQLAAEGRLDDENKEKVAKLFAEHTEEMVKEVRAAEEEDPVLAAEASSEFEDSLDTHEAVLARLIVEQEEEVDEDSRGLVEQVRTAAMEVEKLREEAETKIADEISQEEGSSEITEDNSEEMVESANMRIRAAQRSKVRAEELYKTAQEEIAKLDETAELAQQARAQMEYGESKFEIGKTAFIEHEYNQAYNAFKQAATSFQKVTQLLAVAELFSIEIYTETATDTQEDADAAQQPEGVSDERYEEIETSRREAKAAIEEARSLILMQNGYGVRTLENAHKRIKDAGAYVLRGEIAMVLNDYDDAMVLFERAHSSAHEAVESLAKESKSDDVQDIPSTEKEPTPTELPPIDEDPVAVPPEEDATLLLTHEYEKGIHSYVGTIEVPTPCHMLDYTVAIAESYPEQVNVAIEVTELSEEGVVCTQVVTEKEITIQFSASEFANLTSITLNETPIEWEVVGQGSVDVDTGNAATDTAQTQ